MSAECALCGRDLDGDLSCAVCKAERELNTVRTELKSFKARYEELKKELDFYRNELNRTPHKE
jgi:hypothetical protein